MRWGNIECLKDVTRILKIHNTGLIPANMQVFLRLAHSKFSLKEEIVVILPGMTCDLEVTANLDDSLVTAEELHIMVEEGTCSKQHLLTGRNNCCCIICCAVLHLLQSVQFTTTKHVQYSTVQYSTVQYSTVQHMKN